MKIFNKARRDASFISVNNNELFDIEQIVAGISFESTAKIRASACSPTIYLKGTNL